MNNIKIQSASLVFLLLVGTITGMDRQENVDPFIGIPPEMRQAIAAQLISPMNINAISDELTDMHNLRSTSKKWKSALSHEKINALFAERCAQNKFKSLMIHLLNIIPGSSIEKDIEKQIDHIQYEDEITTETLFDQSIPQDVRNQLEALDLQCHTLQNQLIIVKKALACLALMRPSPNASAAWAKASRLRALIAKKWRLLNPLALTYYANTITRVAHNAEFFTLVSNTEEQKVKIVLPAKKNQMSKRKTQLDYRCSNASRNENNELFHCGIAKENNSSYSDEEIYIAKHDGFTNFIKPELPVITSYPQLIQMPDNKLMLVYSCAQTIDDQPQLICLNQINSSDGSTDDTFGQSGKAFVKLHRSLNGMLLATANRNEIRLGRLKKNRFTLIDRFNLQGQTLPKISWPALTLENVDDDSSTSSSDDSSFSSNESSDSDNEDVSDEANIALPEQAYQDL